MIPEVIYVNQSFIEYGVTFGTALAIAISFNENRSVLWAIVHGFFSWLYVLYYLLTRK